MLPFSQKAFVGIESFEYLMIDDTRGLMLEEMTTGIFGPR